MNFWVAAKIFSVVVLRFFARSLIHLDQKQPAIIKSCYVCSRTFTVISSLQMNSGIDCPTMWSFRIAKTRELVWEKSAVMNRGVDSPKYPTILIWLKPQIMWNWRRRSQSCAWIWLLIYNDLNQDRRDSLFDVFLSFKPRTSSVIRKYILFGSNSFVNASPWTHKRNAVLETGKWYMKV